MVALHQVLGTVKNALVVWMGIIFLAELVTPLQVIPPSDHSSFERHLLLSKYACCADTQS